MKKVCLLFAMAMMTITIYANPNDDRVIANKSDLSKTVTVNQKGNANTHQTPVNRGIYNGVSGTLITFRGFAPYSKQPMDNNYWPRFGIQVGAGYAHSFMTYEAVFEYMQTNIRYPDQPAEYLNSLQGSVRLGGMLPIQISNSVLLIPNIKGQLGGVFGLGGYSTFFQAGLIGGLDFGFKLGTKIIKLGFVYEYRWFVDRTFTTGVGMMGGQLAFVI